MPSSLGSVGNAICLERASSLEQFEGTELRFSELERLILRCGLDRIAHCPELCEHQDT
jgi:hypothetical protein